ncbi:MAG: UDP-N-acetylmuramoyl-L-alanine--D-glutamate ligase [bacterium]
MELKNKNIAIIGMGATGIATANFVLNRGSRVTAYDQKPCSEIKGIESIRSGINLFDNWDGNSLNKCDLVIVSPGVPMALNAIRSAKQAGIEVISEIEFAYRFTDKPVIGVTGTNGKSTTVTLLGQILNNAGRKAGVGGNIGTPFIELVEHDKDYEIYVLELSSYQLEGIESFKPWIAVLLNITEDHLDRYRDMNEYANAKLRIFMNQSVDDYAVINAQDPYIVRNKKLIKAKPYCFTTSKRTRRGAYYKGGSIVYVDGSGGKAIFTINNGSLSGMHNVENAMACIIVSKLLDVPDAIIQQTIDNFKGLHHRIEFVAEFNGVKYYDDSKATNVDAVVVALKTIPAPIILIMGGRDKQGDYAPLSQLIKQKVKLLIVMGESKERIKNTFQELVRIVSVDSMEAAVKTAINNATHGDNVLLSPACSSFDMFTDYKHRGDTFRAMVMKLNRDNNYERL